MELEVRHVTVPRTINVDDKLHFEDKVLYAKENGPQASPHSGMWKRTEVIGGFGDFVRAQSPFGKTTLTDTSWHESNMVVIGGVQWTMEQIYGEKCTQIEIPTLYSETGIGHPDSLPPTDTYETPDGPKVTLYRPGNRVWLFGVGITGTAENDITVHPTDYREKSIEMAKVSSDGLTIRGNMVPFRYTAAQLTELERKRYFGKKTFTDGTIGYYLKKFEQPAQIKHIWKTGEEYEKETLVSSADVWENNTGINAVETFTEMLLRVSKKDVKEWFINLEQKDRTRINTLALYSGEFYRTDENDIDGDYRDVRLFSKLNIPVEFLVLNKDLNIIYRVYGS